MRYEQRQRDCKNIAGEKTTLRVLKNHQMSRNSTLSNTGSEVDSLGFGWNKLVRVVQLILEDTLP